MRDVVGACHGVLLALVSLARDLLCGRYFAKGGHCRLSSLSAWPQNPLPDVLDGLDINLRQALQVTSA